LSQVAYLYKLLFEQKITLNQLYMYYRLQPTKKSQVSRKW